VAGDFDCTPDWFYGRLPDPGVPLRAVSAGIGNQYYLQVIGIGANDGFPYLIWQNGGGTWFWGSVLPDRP
jgi:hypothetical protein